MTQRTIFGLVILCLALAPAAARSASPGQADLDQAIELRLEAKSLEDLTKVIESCQAAVRNGLNEEETIFARRILTGTLVERGVMIGDAIFQRQGQLTLAQALRLRQIALGDLEQSISLDATNPEAHVMVARLEMIPGGNQVRALKALDDALAVVADDDPNRLKILAFRAELHPDPIEKLASFEQALKIDPKSVDVLLARSEVYYKLGNNKAALEDMDAAVKIAPEDAGVRRARGLVLAALDRSREALAELDKSIELNGDSTVTYMHRGRVQLMLDNPEKAVEDLTTSLTLDSSNNTSLLIRAEAYYQLGQKDKALADARRAARQSPDSLDAKRALSTTLASLGKFDEAIAPLEELREASPDNLEVRLQLALVCRAAGQHAKALEHYAAAIEIDATSFEAYRGRGDLLVSQGRYPEAIKDYDKAIEIEPKDAGVLNNYSWLLSTSPDERVRNGKRAVELAEQACQATDYKQAHILSTLAAGYAETGDFATARKWAAEALKLGEESIKTQLEKELQSYQQNKPWREEPDASEDSPIRTATKPGNETK